jgi:hypothetical protein
VHRSHLPAFSLLALLLAGMIRIHAGEPLPRPATDLTGKWLGYWESGKNGHRGPLRATFTRIDECHYRVVFRGRFWLVVPFRYGMMMNVTGSDGDKVILSGSHTLGPVFGSFDYYAEGTCRDFVADFQSRGDYGKFVLTRDK